MTSIVDRLKYHNFDPSWSAVAGYYSKLGGSGTYTGSYSQNTWLIQKMREMGYAKGGTIGKLIDKSGEDGFVLARSGEEILSLDKLKLASDMVDKLIDFTKFTPNVGAIKGMTYSDNSENNVTFNFNLPNVTDSNSFLKEVQTNKKLQKAIQSVTIGQAMNGNSLDVKRFK